MNSKLTRFSTLGDDRSKVNTQLAGMKERAQQVEAQLRVSHHLRTWIASWNQGSFSRDRIWLCRRDQIWLPIWLCHMFLNEFTPHLGTSGSHPDSNSACILGMDPETTEWELQKDRLL